MTWVAKLVLLSARMIWVRTLDPNALDLTMDPIDPDTETSLVIRPFMRYQVTFDSTRGPVGLHIGTSLAIHALMKDLAAPLSMMDP